MKPQNENTMDNKTPQLAKPTVHAQQQERAKALLPRLKKKPEYAHVKLTPVDVVRMATGMGLDMLDKTAPQ